MIDKETILKHFKDLDSIIDELEEMKKYTIEEINTDLKIFWQIEHGLQLAIQNLLDVSGHILSAIKANNCESYTEIITRLSEKNIIQTDIEFYVSVIGNKKVRVLPLREMIFGKIPDDEPRIATYKAKWDSKYRKNWGIKNTFANKLPNGGLKKIEDTCKRAYRVLNMQRILM